MRGAIIRVRHWARSREPIVLISLLIVVGAVWAFAKVADNVVEGDTQTFDERLLRAMRCPDDPARPVGPIFLAEAGRDITALGGVAVLVLVTTAVGGFLALSRRFGMLALVLVATSGGWALSQLLKVAFERPRPAIVTHLTLVSSSSFPSGHTMMSAVVYLTLGTLLATIVRRRTLKAYCLAVALVLTFLVGVSRVYMGVHYPTDVLAGWMTGLAWAALCWAAARWLQQRGAVEAETPPGDPEPPSGPV